MMSLFSSFDLYYYDVIILSTIIFSLLLMSFYTNSVMGHSIHVVLYHLSKFYSSLMKNGVTSFMSLQLISVFLMLLIFNYSSNFYYGFCTSSQLSVVLCMSLFFWASLMMFWCFSNTNSVLVHLIPEGSPYYLSWFIFLVELVSIIIRPLTLTVRLVANMLAGHVLLILLCNLFSYFKFSFIFLIVMSIVEFLVAGIQSFIFCTMILLYFSEME